MTAWFDDSWDVIVVGTGMGGATVGHALAAQGRKLLFLERGSNLLPGPHREPRTGGNGSSEERPEARLAAGQWPTRLQGRTNRGDIHGFPSLGCGTGGSTVLYAAQLERLSACDFEPRAQFASATGSTVPEAWPVRYDEMLPFYRQAEQLFGVCGSADPLSPDAQALLRLPPSMSERDASFMSSFRELGLRPYQAHVGCDFIEGCVGCGGQLCEALCKSDTRKTGLLPALVQHGARLVSDCEVLRLEADAHRVHAARVRWQGNELSVRGELFVLAAGALMTPRILLDSHNAFWPDGLANRSGAVGRNLMFHVSDMVAIRARDQGAPQGPQKAVALNDFYQRGGDKYGSFQSIGIPLDAGIVSAQLIDRLIVLPAPLRRLAELACRVLGRVIAQGLRGSTLFATITEDLPYWHNRVVSDPQAPSGMRFEYHYTAELERRARRFRRQLTQVLRRHHRLLWLSFRHNLNLGHACGTCRFGDDPAHSVLDRSNRAHGIDNLYVVDASFFPSSGGTNPGLTIAANALRVASEIGKRFAAEKTPAGASQ